RHAQWRAESGCYLQLNDYISQADALRSELDERLGALEAGLRIDAVKGNLKDWRQRQDELQRAITSVDPAARRDAGAALNALKQYFDGAISAYAARTATTGSSKLDRSVPARQRWRGGVHPVTQVI